MAARVLAWWGSGSATGATGGGRDPRRRSGRPAAKPSAPPASAGATGAAASTPPPVEPSASGDRGAGSAGGAGGPSPQPPPPPPPQSWGTFLRLLAIHSANLAARLAELYGPAGAGAPWEGRRGRGGQRLREACRRLGVEDGTQLRDLWNAAVLSECVYKIVDHPTERAVELLNEVAAQCPPRLVSLRTVQFLVSEGGDALYVAFMGTKLARDLATNANVWEEEVRLDAAMLSSGATASITGGGAGAAGGSGDDAPGAGAASPGGRAPAAHRGFVQRARIIPIESLYAEACRRGKRLVLCGHSLGGAVAQLCTLRLLQALPPDRHASVACFSFATPALGNTALAELVQGAGWGRRIHNFVNRRGGTARCSEFNDPIPGLLSLRRPDDAAGSGACPSDGAAEQAAAGSGDAGGIATARSAPAQLQSPSPNLPLEAPGGQANNISVVTSQLRLFGLQRLRRIASHMASQPGQPRSQARDAAEESGEEAAGISSSATAVSEGGRRPRTQGSGPRTPAATASLPASAASGEGLPVASPRSASAPVAATVAALAVLDGAYAAPASPQGGEQSLEFELDASGGAAATSRVRSARSLSTMLAAAAPPMRAVAERAGVAARMVAGPLAAAAAAPSRLAPAYLPIGQVLWLTPDGRVSSAPAGPAAAEAPAVQPSCGAAAPVAAATDPASGGGGGLASLLRWPRRQLLGGRGGAGEGALAETAAATATAVAAGSGSFEEEDNVDIAAAADAAAATAAAEAAGASPAAGEAQAAQAVAGDETRGRRSPFHAHRMATYRGRLTSICKGAVDGLAASPAWPLLHHHLPSAGDIMPTELLGPGVFPLSAVASVASPLPAAGGKRAAGGNGAGAPPAAAADGAGVVAPPAGEARWPWRRWPWQQRGGGREGPVELFIRVEGRGLANVTHCYVDGMPPSGGGRPSNGSGNAGGAAPSPPPAAAAVAEIVHRPSPPLPAVAARAQRPRAPIPMLAPVSAFLSWVAVNLGWVALLRQLQPPGRDDYLLARVRLPAAAVRDAAGSPVHLAVGESALPALRLAPRLSLRLHADFTVQSVPLDIRAAVPVEEQKGRGLRHLLRPQQWWRA
eukprot:scaffold1.g5865.t1